MSKVSTKPAISGTRRALYGKTEIAKKELGLDNDTFRDLLGQRYGKRSRTEMSEAELVDLVEHFKGQGFTPQKANKKAKTGRALAQGGEQRKMRALWLSLWHLGAIPDPSEEALAGFARRVTGGKETGIAALQWLHGEAASKVIEALKERAVRDGGVSWAPYKDASGRVLGFNDRTRVIEAQRRKLRALGYQPTFAYEHMLSATAADKLIAVQGAALRALLEARRD